MLTDVRILGVVLVASTILCLQGCREPAVNVGSKFGVEQSILGEILAQHIERRLGRPVNRRLGLGDTATLHQAATSGDVDLYPEYTGTALRIVLKLNMDHDPKAVYERVRDDYAKQFQLECLPPLGYDSVIVAAVTPEMAEAHHLERMSDLEASGVAWKIAYTGDFATRPDGLPTLIGVYRPNVQSAPVPLEPRELYQSLKSKAANLAMVRTSEGWMSQLQAVLLPDDRLVYPPYQGFVVARSRAMTANPQLRTALQELSGKIDGSTMRKMNAEVELQHRAPAEVARVFLERSGLAK
jgi:osmoprotectant transport system substrate-binding protein